MCFVCKLKSTKYLLRSDKCSGVHLALNFTGVDVKNGVYSKEKQFQEEVVCGYLCLVCRPTGALPVH